MPKLELVPRIDQELSTSTAVTSSGGGGGGGGVTDHGALSGLSDNDHPQYVHGTIAGTISAVHTFGPGSSSAPFIIGVNAIGVLVSGLNADLLDGVEASELTLLTTYNAHIADANAHHDAVTLTAAADVVLDLSTQEIDVPNVTANYGLLGPTSGGAAKPTYRAMVSDDLAVHDIVGDRHSVTGSLLDVIGLDGTNTLAVLTPSSNPGANASLLKTDANGRMRIEGFGVGVSPTDDRLEVFSDANPQFRVAHTTGGQADFRLGSGGALNIITDTGDIVFDPAGLDVRPLTNYKTNLGTSNVRYLALYAAELWVQTLVAQDVLSTIGGRILVGPTTELIADVDNSQTTIDVKHNQIASGDIVYSQTAPGGTSKIEAMKITSGATTITGGYRYSVTRGFDGSPANSWFAGDAVFNTGAIGDGFIDIFAEQGVHGSGAGPSIVGNVRTGVAAFGADIEPRWAIGNLDSLYGYSTDTYGFAAGNPNESYITIDETNGIRIFNSTSQKFNLNTGGDLKIGNNISDPATTALVLVANDDTAYNFELLDAGEILIGDSSTSKGNILLNSSGQLLFRDGKNTNVTIDNTGISMFGTTVTTSLITMDTGAHAGTIELTDVGSLTTLEITHNNDVNSLHSELRLGATQTTTGEQAQVNLRANNTIDTSAGLLPELRVIAGTDANSGVIVGKGLGLTQTASQLFEVITDNAGEGMAASSAFVGWGVGFASTTAMFSNISRKGLGVGTGFRQTTAGQVVIDTASGQQGKLRQNNADVLLWQNDAVSIQTGATAGRGIDVEEIAWMGYSNSGSAEFSHFTNKGTVTAYAFQAGTASTFINSKVSGVITFRAGGNERFQVANTEIKSRVSHVMEDDLSVDGDLTVDGDLVVNRSGSDRTGYIYVPLSAETVVYDRQEFDDGNNGSSTAGVTASDLGVPATAKAVAVSIHGNLVISGSSGGDWPAGNNRCYFYVGSGSGETDVGIEIQIEGTTISGSPDSYGAGVVTSSGVARCNGSGGLSRFIEVPSDNGTITIYDLFITLKVTGYWI